MTGKGSLVDTLALWSGLPQWHVVLLLGMLLVSGLLLACGRR